MATLNFYLRKTAATESPIELVYQFKANRIRICIGEAIQPKKWNPYKQRAKETELTTKDGRVSLNGYLKELEDFVWKIYKEELEKGTPSPKVIKNKILEFVRPVEVVELKKESIYDLIDRFIKNEITVKGKNKASATIKTYKTTLSHLMAFEKKFKYPINFESITINFYHKFTSYLREEGKGDNTIGKNIQVIKVFMNTAIDMKLTDNTDFKKEAFSVLRVDTDAVYLTEKEILSFYNYDLSNNKRLERVRDLFVFGCYVGLRFSDYSNIKPENLIMVKGKQFLKVKTQKTDELVIIPCHTIVKQIFEKYYGATLNSLPPTISNQKFNKFIKEAAKIAGLTETGRLSNNLSLPLCECISSHTCRRSFATNYYGKIQTKTLMQITGHKSERTFLRYIKTSKQESAERLHEIMEKEYSQQVLNIVNY